MHAIANHEESIKLINEGRTHDFIRQGKARQGNMPYNWRLGYVLINEVAGDIVYIPNNFLSSCLNENIGYVD